MRQIRALVAQQRGEPALALAEPLAGVLRRLPTGVSPPACSARCCGASTSSPPTCPACPIPVFLAGARMEAQFPFGPMSGAATNITLMSYLDEAQIGVNLDPAAVTDPDVFLECLHDGFDEVLKAG